MISADLFNQIVSLSGLTIYGIAKACGLNPASLYEYQKGAKSPNLDTLLKITNTLHLSICIMPKFEVVEDMLYHLAEPKFSAKVDKKEGGGYTDFDFKKIVWIDKQPDVMAIAKLAREAGEFLSSCK